MLLPVASAKLLLIPLGIVAFLAFLLLIGAIGLGIALSVISGISWLARLPSRLARSTAARRRKADRIGT